MTPKLFPYLRDAAAAAQAQGEAIVSPMVLAFQADPAAAAHDFQYMLGPCLLVAPVYQAGATAWPVYLPKGHAWVDFWTGAAHEGGRTVEVAAPLDRIPLLVRSGCLLELVPEDVETLLPASAELAPGVKPLGPERVLQVWGDAAVDHALENPDLRAKVSHLETGDSILEVELHGAAPYALELQIMHADVSDVTVDSSTQGKVRARCARVAAADDYLGRPHTSCQLPEEPGNLLVQWKRRPGGGEAGA